ncbi:hypothetical protein THAOC_14890, partial [Thalassiosira oceanica]
MHLLQKGNSAALVVGAEADGDFPTPSDPEQLSDLARKPSSSLLEQSTRQLREPFLPPRVVKSVKSRRAASKTLGGSSFPRSLWPGGSRPCSSDRAIVRAPHSQFQVPSNSYVGITKVSLIQISVLRSTSTSATVLVIHFSKCCGKVLAVKSVPRYLRSENTKSKHIKTESSTLPQARSRTSATYLRPASAPGKGSIFMRNIIAILRVRAINNTCDTDTDACYDIVRCLVIQSCVDEEIIQDLVYLARESDDWLSIQESALLQEGKANFIRAISLFQHLFSTAFKSQGSVERRVG